MEQCIRRAVDHALCPLDSSTDRHYVVCAATGRQQAAHSGDRIRSRAPHTIHSHEIEEGRTYLIAPSLRAEDFRVGDLELSCGVISATYGTVLHTQSISAVGFTSK